MVITSLITNKDRKIDFNLFTFKAAKDSQSGGVGEGRFLYYAVIKCKCRKAYLEMIWVQEK